ncbi:MAG TPA: DUF3303 family protein [Vicinamibacterales bacterium]|nr:DUF3303 family protein [Vicinamibacterales bacterium]
MVIERFKPGMAPEVYRRFRERGRMAPDDVRYVASWVDLNIERCFQVMEAENEERLREWTRHWEDLTDFEIVSVRTSAEAAALMNR